MKQEFEYLGEKIISSPAQMDIVPLSNQAIAVQQCRIDEEIFKRYIDFLDLPTESSATTYRQWLSRFIEWLKTENNTTPTREDIIRYRDYLYDLGRSPSTVAGYILAVKSFFQWTAQFHLYENIADRIKTKKVSTEHKRDALTSQQAIRLLESVDRTTLIGKRDYAILAMMLTCGLRDTEVVNANVEDLRPRGDHIVIYVLGKGHAQKDSFVIVHDGAERAVRDYLAERGVRDGSEPLFASVGRRKAVNKDGSRPTVGRLRVDSLSKIVKNRLIAAGYNSKRLTAHSMRHTAVTLSLLSGKSLQETKVFARHKNINTTLIYDHSIKQDQNTCGEAVSNAIFRDDEISDS